MKKLKYSTAARILAVVLAVTFGLLTAAGCLTTLLTYAVGLYSNSLKEVQKNYEEQLQKYYSTKIFTELKSGSKTNTLKNSGMEYGILHTDTLDSSNLSDTSKYLYQNFSKTKPNKDSYATAFNQTSEDTYCGDTPTLLEALTEQYDYNIGVPATKELCEPIKQIVYATDTGRFYFETASYSFPLEQIFVDNKFLIADGLDDDLASSIPKMSKDELAELTTFSYDESIHKYVSAYDTYQPLKATEYKKWKTLGFPYSLYDEYDEHDEYTENFLFRTKDIKETTTDKLKPAAADDMYLFQTDNTDTVFSPKNYPSISYTTEVASDGDIYWVVSNVSDTSGNSLFAKQRSALTFLYDFRNTSLILTFLCGVCFLLMTAFCCYYAGKSSEDAPLTIRFYHRIPLLLYLMAAAGCEGILLFIKYTLYKILLLDNSTNTLSIMFFNVVCTIIGILIFLLAAMNISVRTKGKLLRKYSLCHYLAAGIKKIFYPIYHICRTHTSLTVKCVLLFGLFSVIEVFWWSMTIAGSFLALLIWLLFKFVELALLIFTVHQMKLLQNESKQLAEGNLDVKLDTDRMFWEFKKHGDYLNQIGNGMTIALEEKLKSERFKTELITNVSHDIKTPLTSIINYVDLLQKEPAASDNAKEYLEVLQRQSARLKKLIEDLIEASKASTGNLSVNLESCDISILLTQTVGEFEEKLAANNLQLITQSPDSSVIVQADNRHLWRIFDNLMNNICKYAQPGTRVYINLEMNAQNVRILFRNTSKYALNINSDELTERFVRGDVSRNTEGNGLGLSIAQSLAELMHGSLEIITDGDLFKAIVTLPLK